MGHQFEEGNWDGNGVGHVPQKLGCGPSDHREGQRDCQGNHEDQKGGVSQFGARLERPHGRSQPNLKSKSKGRIQGEEREGERGESCNCEEKGRNARI